MTIRLEVFEGPLELLLSIIERNELDITRVSLAAVTDQFLAHVESGIGIELDQLSGYLVMASKLLLIKSRLLLPPPPSAQTTVVDEALSDPAEDLARQLREYRRFKVVTRWLQERDESGLRSWPRRVPPSRREVQVNLAPIPVSALQHAFQRVQTLEPFTEPDEPARRATVAEQIIHIQNALSTRDRVTFRSLLPAAASIDIVVATFLAVLDLVRRRVVDVEQPAIFGEITVRRV